MCYEVLRLTTEQFSSLWQKQQHIFFPNTLAELQKQLSFFCWFCSWFRLQAMTVRIYLILCDSRRKGDEPQSAFHSQLSIVWWIIALFICAACHWAAFWFKCSQLCRNVLVEPSVPDRGKGLRLLGYLYSSVAYRTVAVKSHRPGRVQHRLHSAFSSSYKTTHRAFSHPLFLYLSLSIYLFPSLSLSLTPFSLAW